MNRWLARQIGAGLEHSSGPVILLDPDGVLADHDIESIDSSGETVQVSDWLELRRFWDLDLRRRSGNRSAVLLVTSTAFQFPTDLPWDIQNGADAVTRIRWPVPEPLRGLFKVSFAQADRLVDAAARHNVLPTVAAAEAFEIKRGDLATELAEIARLHLTADIPAELWEQMTSWFTTPIAQAVAEANGELTPLQTTWNDWLASGGQGPRAAEMESAAGSLISLLTNGLLQPAPSSGDGCPAWALIGVREPDQQEVLRELLERRPEDPENFDGWVETASWWGQVRFTISRTPASTLMAGDAWQVWEEIDRSFIQWLRGQYGTTLLSAVGAGTYPKGVHQIAKFLARRVDAGTRVLLVVLDGLGFAQWHQLRQKLSLQVKQAVGCLAMVPTLTSISRQAIFAGVLPRDFAASITTTRKEPKLWTSFWTDNGLDRSDIAYDRVLGGYPDDVPELRGQAAAVVVNAVDEILHGAEVLGDRQVAAGIDAWAQAGFLASLLETAANAGFETWITSDHGNLETMRGEIPREGKFVESAGKRVRLYPNSVLRDAASAYGQVWDPPGYPEDANKPLFATGRMGFQTAPVCVSHGGLSIDEVIVPLVEVTM